MERRLLAAVPVVVLAVCLYLVYLPLYVVRPGTADDALPLIDIDGPTTYESEGRLLFTTVYSGPANVYYALRAWLDEDDRVFPESFFLVPGQTDAEYDAQQLSAMDQSKLAAAYVALSEVTRYPRSHGEGAVIEAVEPGTSADGYLFPGDLIVEADGSPIHDLPDLTRAIDQAGVGGTVTLAVEPIEGGDRREVTLRPGLFEGEPTLGVYLMPNFPFEVRIESGNVGGPSAGLLWAIGIVDLLTPSDLTEGRTLAGTGEIDRAGNVLPIGGITEKIIAAERAGAELFLVPEANMDEALTAPVDLELVSVSTLDDALRALEQ